MSLHRSIFVAVATVFAVGMAPSAYAQCCGGYAPAQVYTAPAPCGGCGTPVYAPIVYATPVAPAPINVGCGACGAPAPVTWNSCNTCGVQTPVYTQPAPMYVVNQGPDYSSPGVMVPFRTYAPPAQYAPPPYYPSYGRRYYPRPIYRHAYYHPRMYYGTRPYYPHHYWRG
jgi:hypothetical protein